MTEDGSRIRRDTLPTFQSGGENTETGFVRDVNPMSAEEGKIATASRSRNPDASERNLSVSPYLLRPLRTHSQAAEDRRNRQDRENDNRQKQRSSIFKFGFTPSAFTRLDL